jgi:peptide/nickel transport system substrate-binding protein
VTGCLALAVVPAVAQTTGSPLSGAPKTLRVIPQTDLTLLDPEFGSSPITREYGMLVYEELFAWDSLQQPKPQMVDSWTISPDQLTWRFKLREELKFHDGQPVTTADVIPRLKRWMGHDVVGSKLASSMASLEAIDDRTFELRLARPYPSLLFSLGSAIGAVPVIMRAKDLQGDASKPITTAIGSGPFRLDKAATVSGHLVVFERNPDYVPRSEPADGLAGGRRVKVDRLEWRIIPDAATAAAALQNGEVDIWEQPSLDLVPLLARYPKIKVQVPNPLSDQAFLRPNALHPPFNDVRGRQSLAYMIEQGDELAAGFGDETYWGRCNSYFICGGPYGTEAGTEDFRHDYPRARRLLAEAGYRGEKLIFVVNQEVAARGRMAEVAAGALRRAGVNVEIVWLVAGAIESHLRKKEPPEAGGWNLFLGTISGTAMHHPLTNLGTEMACDGRNFLGWPCDERAEMLRQDFLDADDAGRPAPSIAYTDILPRCNLIVCSASTTNPSPFVPTSMDCSPPR